MASSATDQSSSDSSAATNASSEATAATCKPFQRKMGSDQKLSQQQVDLAVASLRYQGAFYLQAIQAMLDGATLGAEQVQDKRLDILEQGPTTDFKTNFLAFLTTLILEGTVAPAIAAMATRYILRPVMQSISMGILRMQDVPNTWKQINLLRQNAFQQSELAIRRGGPMGGRERGDLIIMAKNLRASADSLQNDLRGKLGKSRPIRDALIWLTDFTADNLVAGAKGGVTVANLPDLASTPSQTGNTPGVSVMAATMAKASLLRLSFIAGLESNELAIRQPDVKSSMVNDILDAYELETRVELSALRESYQLAAEAMIWARLLIDEQTRSFVEYHKRGEPIPGEMGLPYSLTFPEKASKHVPYLITRFQKEVERWALENDTRLPSEITSVQIPPRTTGWWETKLRPREREDLLVQYLTAVSEATPEFKLKK